MTDGRDQKTETSAPHDLVAQALRSLRHGYFADARSYIQTYAADHKREAQHYLIEGLAMLATADWLAARDLFRQACADFPDQAQFWFNRGLAEENLEQLDEATASYQRSISLKPDYGEAYGNLSNIFRRQRRFPEAVQMACRAIAAGADKASALNVLALALGKQGNFSEAEKALDEAITLAPDDPAIRANRANLAVDQLKFNEAWELFASACALDKSAIIRRDEGMARLLAGNYVKGLPLYESRLELPKALRLHPECPRWQGEPLSGKTLLLISEQGFGDTIQFSRYAHKLAEAGADLIWTVRPPLQRLLAANVPGRVILESDPLPEADFWLPILSLPFALGMTSALPPASPDFHAPTLPRLPDAPGKRKIGLVWSGSPTHERDHERSIPLALLAPLWEKIDAQFYAPFKGATTALSLSVIPAKAGIQADSPQEMSQHSYSQPLPIIPLDSGFRRNDAVGNDRTQILPLDHLITDFSDMAALLSQLDCLITVDTAAAHLAGALGLPTYLLLPHCPDWRWGASGEATAWYESLTLLRQPSYGDWNSVIQKLLAALSS